MSNFRPSRLTLARQRRGMTRTELADRVECTGAAISQFESTGSRTSRVPADATLARIALALQFPVEFFGLPEVDLLESATETPRTNVASFRSLRSLTMRDRSQALAAGVLAAEFAAEVGRVATLPPVCLPDFRGEKPELAAQLARDLWGLGTGPVAHMLDVLEAAGVRVFWMRTECRAVDAFSFWRGGTPFVILGNHKTPERSRRDAAHELAHLVLHRHGDVCGREAEDEAERFASEFLLPARQFMAECGLNPSGAKLGQLKRRWAVSRLSIARRAHELGLLVDWAYRSECIAANRAGRHVESDPIAREQSQVFTGLLPKLYNLGITIDVTARALAVSPGEIENLLPLDSPGNWRARPQPGRVLHWVQRRAG